MANDASLSLSLNSMLTSNPLSKHADMQCLGMHSCKHECMQHQCMRGQARARLAILRARLAILRGTRLVPEPRGAEGWCVGLVCRACLLTYWTNCLCDMAGAREARQEMAHRRV